MKNSYVSDFVKNYKWKGSPLSRKRDWKKLGMVLSAAVSDEIYVPLSVLGRNRFAQFLEKTDGEKKQLLFDSNEAKTFEVQAIADLIEFGFNFYGKPVFDYHNVDEDRWEDVDFWRNVLKFGRVTMKGAGEKRLQTLNDIEQTPTGKWNPVEVHVNAAVERLHSSYTMSVVNDGHNTEVKLSIDKSTTNSGEPWYTRKNKSFDGQPVRKLIAEEGKSLSFAEVSQLPAFLGARNQQGKWAVGDKNVEDILVEVYEQYQKSGAHSVKICDVLQGLTFNTKARVISAASSIASYQAAPLINKCNENQIKNPNTSSMRFLGGPLGIKKALEQMRDLITYYKDKRGIQLIGYNADAKGYDTTLRSQHGDLFLDAILSTTPRYQDKEQWIYIVGSSLIRPLLFLETPIQLSKDSAKAVKNNIKVNQAEYLHSGEPDTNLFGSTVMFLTTYASRRQANDKWEDIVDCGVSMGIMPLQVIGDDNLALYEVGKDGTILEDLRATIDSQQESYGLNYHEADSKGELGLYLGQFRLTKDGRFITPLSRLKLYWSETNSTALPTYLESLKLWQLLEFRWDCKGILDFLTRFVFPYDKTKIGLIDVKTGNLLTVEGFVDKLKKAEEEEGLSIKQMLGGITNPTESTSPENAHYEVDQNDRIVGVSDWLRTQYDRVLNAYNYYVEHRK